LTGRPPAILDGDATRFTNVIAESAAPCLRAGRLRTHPGFSYVTPRGVVSAPEAPSLLAMGTLASPSHCACSLHSLPQLCTPSISCFTAPSACYRTKCNYSRARPTPTRSSSSICLREQLLLRSARTMVRRPHHRCASRRLLPSRRPIACAPAQEDPPEAALGIPRGAPIVATAPGPVLKVMGGAPATEIRVSWPDPEPKRP
jgi:hypothetical protein